MHKKGVTLGISLGIMVLGVAYLAKKTGFFDDDSYLYDEYESNN